MGIARKTTEVKYVLKGPQGNKGAKLRMRQWAVGQECLSGAGNEPFYDVVLFNDKLYLCLKSHTASIDNNPIFSVAQNLGFWEMAQDWVFIATKLLLAEKIDASQIDVDSLRVKHLDGADGTFTGELKGGSVNVGDGKILLGKSGNGHLADGAISWDANGNATFSEKVKIEGFSKGLYMGPDAKYDSGKYTFSLKERDSYTDSVIVPVQTANDDFVLPANEVWVGRLLCVLNNSTKYSLKINGGGQIPANGCGLFLGGTVFSNPKTQHWHTISIGQGGFIIGFNPA